MPKIWVVAVAAVGVLGATACGSPDTASANDTSVDVADLLLEASDLPPGAQVHRLPREDQMILNLNIHAPSSGIGADMNPVFDPAHCEGESHYADNARARLIEKGTASGALLESGGAYMMLVSETRTDVPRVVEAHTGQCSSYTVTSTSFGSTSQRSYRTESLDLPPALADEDAAILHEVGDPDNPDWSNDEVFLGYAAVDEYSVVVIAFEKPPKSEFDDVFTRAVEKVRRLG
ncbi:MAG: hypothetical protein GX610_03120 [Rhodococcus sp.]|nr:hypothetical protein [Rhodococcus sp. (in: high G+C Gram-positive bacteria)]